MLASNELRSVEARMARETALMVLKPSGVRRIASQWDAIAARRIQIRRLGRKPQVADSFPCKGAVCR